jgi:adenosine deaminase
LALLTRTLGGRGLLFGTLRPGGQSRLREIFLKTSNFIKGKYMAEITQELMRSLEDTKYQSAEYRISIYGRSPDEWTQLASWFIDNKIHSDNVRYASGSVAHSFAVGYTGR